MRADTGVGPFHGVGQPREERDLRRLPHGGHEQQQADGRPRPRPEQRVVREDPQVRDRPRLVEDEEDGDQEAHVGQPVVEKGLLPGTRRAVAFEPEGDEPVRAQAHPLPPHESEDQVVGQHQDQHRGHEEVHVDEELRVVPVALHVPDRIQMDQGADPGDEQHHRHRQGIDQQRRLHLQAAHGDPREQALGEFARRTRRSSQEPGVGDTGHHEGASHRGRPDPPRPRIAEPAPGGGQYDEAGQRQQRHQIGGVEHRSSVGPVVSVGPLSPSSDGGRRPSCSAGAGRWPPRSRVPPRPRPPPPPGRRTPAPGRRCR